MSTSAPTDCAVQALAPAAVPDSTTVVACPFNPDSAIIKEGAFLEDIYEGMRIARVVAPLADTDRVDVTHDLIPGQYEGGLKIWECSIDLVNHFLRRTELHSGSVLELGCGHGLPAVASLLKGCRPVVLSDFNEDVLSGVTWPNIVRNCNTHSVPSSGTRCVAGDWLALSSELQRGKYPDVPCFFDLILSAETLYSSESSVKVLHMLLNHLKEGGIALVATKRYYFGVGGGSMDFLNLVLQHRNLKAEVIAVFEDGSSNTREIIQVSKLR